ncbi:MAG: choice-of-anchor tandem repeat GloVer-containing protein [Terriglobales bacterium]
MHLIPGNRSGFATALVLGFLLNVTASAQAQSLKILHSFGSHFADGANPVGGVVRDPIGDLYGTTYYGGANTCSGLGCGTVFKITTKLKEKVLYSFCSQGACTDGQYPSAGLVIGKGGKLYGTTSIGGAAVSGTVFTVKRSGGEEVVYSFCTSGFPCVNGYGPAAALAVDSHGNLYSTTVDGGAYNYGTVFRVTPSGAETALYSFCGQGGLCADGAHPQQSLIVDKSGNIYGTTPLGGAHNAGTVFELTPDGTEKVLHSFGAQPGDGVYPEAGMVMDSNGNLFGTTNNGGGTSDGGVVFEITSSGKEMIFYTFCSQSNCNDGANPFSSGLVLDNAGNLYGTTFRGGANGTGAVFEVSWNGTEKVLYSFCNQAGCVDGANPAAGVVLDASGTLYGTTEYGGANNKGIVFGLTP